MRRWLGAAVAVALLAAAAMVNLGREREARQSALPTAASTGPRGLAALRTWLAESGHAPLLLEAAGEEPPPGAVILLAAPRAELSAAEADALLRRVERGGLLVWAVGPLASQPELERRLAVSRRQASGRAGPPGVAAFPLAPHPLLAGLELRTGGGNVESDLPAALPVAGDVRAEPGKAPWAAAVSLPRGDGEVLLLAGTDLLENRWLAEGDNLSFWVRVAARGRMAFDERWREPRQAPAPASLLGIALLAGQSLLAAAAFLWARGRRLGSIRPPPPTESGRTAADYLASLATLYRRAGAEPELCRQAWRRFRLDLERRAGIPAALDDEAAARRLERTRPAASLSFREAAALAREAGSVGPRALFRLVRAVAAAEMALGPRRPSSLRSRIA